MQVHVYLLVPVYDPSVLMKLMHARPTVWRELQKENKDFFQSYFHSLSPRPLMSKTLGLFISFEKLHIQYFILFINKLVLQICGCKDR